MSKMSDMYVTKGTKVHVERLKINDKPHALSGFRMKLGAFQQSFTGIVRHVRGDHPTEPTEIGVWVQPDSNAEKHEAEMCEECGVLEVGPIKLAHVWPLTPHDETCHVCEPKD